MIIDTTELAIEKLGSLELYTQSTYSEYMKHVMDLQRILKELDSHTETYASYSTCDIASSPAFGSLTLVLLNKLRCHTHF